MGDQGGKRAAPAWGPPYLCQGPPGRRTQKGAGRCGGSGSSYTQKQYTYKATVQSLWLEEIPRSSQPQARSVFFFSVV